MSDGDVYYIDGFKPEPETKNPVKMKYLYGETVGSSFKKRVWYFYDLFFIGGGHLILSPLKIFIHLYLAAISFFLLPLILSLSFKPPLNFEAYRHMSFSVLMKREDRLNYWELKRLEKEGNFLKKMGVKVIRKEGKTIYTFR